MKRLFFPLLILGCISATTSCKKEIAANQNQVNSISSTSFNNDIVADTTRFGALICTGSTADKIVVMNKLGVKYATSQIEVAVIENEPTTTTFYSGPIEDYITELAVAIDVCHSRGVKVADGSVNTQYVQRIANGLRLFGTAITVQKLITAYITLPLDFVNVHTQGSGTTYPDGLLQLVANYLRTTTGHPVMSNEWHLESNETTLVQSMVKGWKEGGYVYSLIYGGGGTTNATAINSGLDLLPNGETYKNSIQ